MKIEEKIITILREGPCFNISTKSSLGITCEEIEENHINNTILFNVALSSKIGVSKLQTIDYKNIPLGGRSIICENGNKINVIESVTNAISVAKLLIPIF